MIASITGRLIAKDLYFNRWLVIAAVLVGLVSVPLMQLGPGDSTDSGVNIGFIVFITAIMALGIFIVMYGFLKERQEKSILFVLSLPVTAMQYTLAKVISALIAFLVPWAILTAGMICLIAAVESSPDGAIPAFLAMMTFFLGNFCVLLALIMATLSERWAIAGILITNTFVPVFLGLFFGLPGVEAYQEQELVTWSPAVLTVIGVSLAVALLSLGLALYYQSRKRDFI